MAGRRMFVCDLIEVRSRQQNAADPEEFVKWVTAVTGGWSVLQHASGGTAAETTVKDAKDRPGMASLECNRQLLHGDRRREMGITAGTIRFHYTVPAGVAP